MAKHRYRIFYLETAWEQVYHGGPPIYRVARELPVPDGSVQICYAFFPEYRKKSFFRKRLIPYKPSELQKYLDELEQRALTECGCREILFARDFGKEGGGSMQQDLPTCVLQAWLHAARPFDTLYVTAEWGSGMYALEQLLELLMPYLPRLRQLVWAGEQNGISEDLESYLYEEYGMVLLFTETIPAEGIVLQKTQAWKFLDATVKNGYNTLVH